jgi:hypothetical protein
VSTGAYGTQNTKTKHKIGEKSQKSSRNLYEKDHFCGACISRTPGPLATLKRNISSLCLLPTLPHERNDSVPLLANSLFFQSCWNNIGDDLRCNYDLKFKNFYYSQSPSIISAFDLFSVLTSSSFFTHKLFG